MAFCEVTIFETRQQFIAMGSENQVFATAFKKISSSYRNDTCGIHCIIFWSFGEFVEMTGFSGQNDTPLFRNFLPMAFSL